MKMDACCSMHLDFSVRESQPPVSRPSELAYVNIGTKAVRPSKDTASTLLQIPLSTDHLLPY